MVLDRRRSLTIEERVEMQIRGVKGASFSVLGVVVIPWIRTADGTQEHVSVAVRWDIELQNVQNVTQPETKTMRTKQP